MVLPLQGEQIVLALGHEPAIARLAQQCLFGLAWGILPALKRRWHPAKVEIGITTEDDIKCRSAMRSSPLRLWRRHQR
ncbi:MULTISPECIES: hypothetical protein [unclassified Bradyrhizobium]|uniref:hypothetical protein n=1 Tax=unclassified Bradyrhizobium TaxID=2631580 RepID=UPI002306C764|nr:hypothetical protein [Bradyrhizobium sp. CCBAU 21359]